MGFGAIAGAVGAKFLDAGISTGQSMIASAEQYRRTKKITENSPSWKMAGLKKAGLNPILAAGTFGGATTSSPMPSIPATPGVADNSAKFSKSSLDKNLSSSAKSHADIAALQRDWEIKKYKYMHKNDNVFLPISGATGAGYSPHSASDAIKTVAILKGNEQLNKNRKPRSKYQKVKKKAYHKSKGGNYTEGKKSYGVSGGW